jgi:arylsulfatase A-like enzyme
MISRRELVQGALFQGASMQGTGAGGERRPNVVFVFADQWRAQAFGYTGDANARTPEIDALAGESFDFTHAVSGTPVCSPYRASLMTGQYAERHGVVLNDVELRPSGETLGACFRKAGYATGYIGKWHLYGSPDGKFGRRLAPIPEASRFGFEYWRTCECTHNYNRSLYFAGDDPTPRYWEGYDAVAQTRDACAFIRERARQSDPYFLVLSLGPPHDPYGTAPEEQRALFRDRELQLRANVPDSHRAKAAEELRGYYAHGAALDQCVGEVRKAIEDSGKAEDTIFVFTSDHGDMLQSQGLPLKQFPWDESIRVPFLVRYPRGLGRRRRAVSTPMNAPDVMPTLLGLAGLRVPETVQGRNWAPLMTGKEAEAEEAAALLSLPVAFSVIRGHGIAEYRGVRTARYTYVRSIHGPWLLYDNERDPYQKQNLVNTQGALRSRLDRRLDGLLREAGDAFLPGQRYLERAKATHYGAANNKVGQTKSPWGDWESNWK